MQDTLLYFWEEWFKNRENLPLTISIFALVSSILFNRITFKLAKKQSVASLKPLVSFSVVRNDRKKTIKMSLINFGLGPAKITKIEHLKDGHLYKNISVYNFIKSGIDNGHYNLMQYYKNAKNEKRYNDLFQLLEETSDTDKSFNVTKGYATSINWLKSGEKSKYLHLRCKERTDYIELLKFTERFVTIIEYTDIYGGKESIVCRHNWNL